jgi:hypothetical protein
MLSTSQKKIQSESEAEGTAWLSFASGAEKTRMLESVLVVSFLGHTPLRAWEPVAG